MKVGIVIPAYNEEKRIAKTLEVYTKAFNTYAKKDKFSYQIYIVINNTKDKSPDIIKSFAKKNKTVKYVNLVKGGKGYAVIEGFKYFLAKKEFDIIGFVDADLASPPQAFYDLIKNNKHYDATIASRYVPGAKVYPKQSLQRIIVSRIFNMLIRIFFFMPYRDTQCGAKVFTSKALQKIVPSVSMSQWAFDVELLYMLRKYGLRVHEIPTVWSDQQYSKIHFWKSGSRMLLAIIRLRLINSPFSFLVKLYNRFSTTY